MASPAVGRRAADWRALGGGAGPGCASDVELAGASLGGGVAGVGRRRHIGGAGLRRRTRTPAGWLPGLAGGLALPWSRGRGQFPAYRAG